MNRNLTLIILTFTTFLQTYTNAAPVPWPVSSGGNGHFYEAVRVPSGIKWTDAKLTAEAAGGQLATIASAAENAFVFSLIDDPLFWNSYSGPWLGGTQPPGSPEPAGNWQWLTGEPFSYTNWSVGQPNNTGEIKNEDSLHFWRLSLSVHSSYWNDIAGGSVSYRPVGYVVEIIPEPDTLILASLVLFEFVTGAGIVYRGVVRGSRFCTGLPTPA
jgi:hypothetical protein